MEKGTLRRRLWLLAALVVASVAVVALWRSGPGAPGFHGRTAPEGTIAAYLAALEARDRRALSRLVPDDFDAGADVEDRLTRYGGARAAQAKVEIHTDVSPEAASARIRTAVDDGRELAWVENLYRRDGSWWMAWGRLRRAPLGAAPSQPSGIERPAPRRPPGP